MLHSVFSVARTTIELLFFLYYLGFPFGLFNFDARYRLYFQLYTAYVESQEQLQLERLENKRVNKYLDDIVQEVEAKAPILKRQRDEHERMQKSVASLSAKLEQAVKVGSADQMYSFEVLWNFQLDFISVFLFYSFMFEH